MNDVIEAIKQICKEKGLSYEAVIETVEQALAAAYRKDFGLKDQNIRVNFNPQTGKIKAFDVKLVVDYGPEEEIEEISEENPKNKEAKKEEKYDKERKIDNKGYQLAAEEAEKKKFNTRFHLTLDDAKKIKKDAKVGEEIITELEVSAPFGRMAAQTAKQVIIQRLKEAERDVLFKEFKEKEGSIVSGIIQRREGRNFLVDLGKAVAVLPFEQQIRTEYYTPGQKVKVFILSSSQNIRGPEIIVSRSHAQIVRELFTLEIPEIASGAVEIKAIAREAGVRTKIAVTSSQDNLDPIGACIGQRGSRIQTIIAELGGEKIDIIEYNEDFKKFITNALSPAKILSVELDEKSKIARVKVKADQFSLAIGRGGQNVRLASSLTGWNIEIKEGGKEEEKPEVKIEEKAEVKNEKKAVSEEKTEKKESKKKAEKTEKADKTKKVKEKKTDKKVKKEKKEKV